MKKSIFTLLVILFAATSVFAQSKREKEVKNLFAQIEKTDSDAKKTELANRIQHEMAQILVEENDFFYDFPSLPNVGKIMSSDQQIHMYTWNVLLSDGTSQYYALFHHNEYHALYSLSRGMPIIPTTNKYFSEKDWYGALYYDIHPIKYNDKEMYMVFGLIISADGETQHKVIDVLSFSKKAIKMGAPSFITPWTGKRKQHRVLFQYDKEAQLSLEYNPKKKTIVFDHLAPIRKTKDGKDIMAPDMSYDALVYKKDIWTYQKDINAKNKKDKKDKKDKKK